MIVATLSGCSAPGPVDEKTLKTAASSIYGNSAHDVAEQRSWIARAQEEEFRGGSLTSPYHASMTTSLVRTQRLALMN